MTDTQILHTGPTDAERQTLDIFYRAFTDKNPDLLDDVVTADWDDIPLAPGQGPGAAGLKPLIQGFVTAFPDTKIVIDDMIGGNGQVAVRARITGTHEGTFFGIPGTGKRVDIRIHEFHTFENGRIRTTWHLEDWFGMFNQLGAFPPSSNT